MWDLLLVLLCSVGACCEITTGEEGGPHVQEQDRKWAEHVKPLLLGCRVQRWEKFAQLVCCAVITSYFLAHRVTWWLLIWGWCGDPALTKMCFSYLVQLPCLHVCVPGRGGIWLHLHSIPSIAVAIYFFFLELCDAASCSVLCAIRIAQQWSVRGKQLHKGFAWFWEVVGACVCLVGEGVRF